MTDTTTRARALLEAATPLPWRLDSSARSRVYAGGFHDSSRCIVDTQSIEDAALIVKAVNAYPALLDVAEKAERLTDAWFDWRRSPEMGAAAVTVATEEARAALSKLRESE